MEPTAGVTPPRVLTIAGTDSGGGAGVAADLRAMAACGAHGCVAVTAVTVQNTLGVTGVHVLPPETVAAQIESVALDIGLGAAKTGMLAGRATIEAVAAACDRVGIGAGGTTPFVVDPVAASMHGDPLLADDALDAFRSLLFPRATLVTPNLDEVRLLVGVDVHDRASQYEAAKVLHALGPRSVLVKGGHLVEDADRCVDLLYDGSTFTELPGPRFDTGNTHGGGDNMASAVACGLARGLAVPEAVALAKRYIVEAVRHSYPLGAGHGPVSPLWTVRRWWEE
ncbi:bifunctional hydroxymethylpyrimidine kinase/phosphomethylpyrimidine kinase [Pseudonocardia sp. KRD-184]|uniref:Bifunctional hydroxymethylpyrimidine kinase/phosphomethylpyrimidine kinase n=1 Tax=Pseudonocardia oceani TaxID=2792013 RepID=A0ABS6U7T9_9PSEU|nr:bifunctional hydroxymethylpyrimidine kinase/phosphomethylpyrimidine kinase [Pseudonocardia oceani]MBW0091182.1 bifunctional hydroxymethylpyrimidine kinase/phosphomethylpyrimidine kinase [Pseudonocardia oceani]MBW0098261.1 bifunctional hydroxymethylpyrimidine kinase/phosphomethylpyrimidine kinase [Pseudonocardia oceani]MBW0110860.1 bifunctional hydroxymethylpyrimidine kinase/phosphomethylpyrimidine kinase [Pseudonocardia oceani]MBW0122853.1 bifunctional hydroxymethylpyrimidine kinase/phosphom